MDRRAFLQVLAAATVAVPALSLIPEAALPKAFPATLPSLAGIRVLEHFRAVGNASESRIAEIEIAREGGAVILKLSLQAFGGGLSWMAGPADGLYFKNKMPIIRCTDPEVAWSATIRDANSRRVDILGFDGEPYAHRFMLPELRGAIETTGNRM